jgi:hypothetical protein
LFEKHVEEHFDSYFEGHEITDERRTELWSRIQNDVLMCIHDGESRAYEALFDFHPEDFPRLFEDCWEWNCKEYTFHFIWNLYAIAWAIQKYDHAKAAAAPADQTA